MKNILEVEKLTKDFTSPLFFADLIKFNFKRAKPTRALEDISFSLETGKILGVLGPNGAGKTTLLKTIATLMLPDKGRITIGGLKVGENDERIKSLIGLATSEERSFYWRLTGMQNLEFFAALYGLSKEQTKQRIADLFRIFKINYAHKRFDFYSTGMKIKFSLIRALLHNPQILLLDEPTKSLDYNASAEVRNFIKSAARNNTTIIFASHNLEEAQGLCELFLLLNNGRICAFGSISDLRRQVNSPNASLAQIYLKLTQNA